MDNAFYTQCQAACGAEWEQAVQHDFVLALSAGTLNKAQLRNYLIQDGLYLNNYIQVCRMLAEKAQTASERQLFLDSARLSEEAELGLQTELAAVLELGWEQQEPWPATLAYMQHERDAALHASPLVGLAVATPCTTVYAAIGKHLSMRPEAARADHPFRLWLDLYAAPEVQEMASAWMACLDRWAMDASAEELHLAQSGFAESVRCEIAFWEQAWRSG